MIHIVETLQKGKLNFAATTTPLPPNAFERQHSPDSPHSDYVVPFLVSTSVLVDHLEGILVLFLVLQLMLSFLENQCGLLIFKNLCCARLFLVHSV